MGYRCERVGWGEGARVPGEQPACEAPSFEEDTLLMVTGVDDVDVTDCRAGVIVPHQPGGQRAAAANEQMGRESKSCTSRDSGDLSEYVRLKLALCLSHYTEMQVEIWFHNRRTRWKQ